MTEMFKVTADRFYDMVEAGYVNVKDRESLKGLAIAMLEMIDDGFDGLTEAEKEWLAKTAADLCESFIDWHDVDGVSTFALLKRCVDCVYDDMQTSKETWEEVQREDAEEFAELEAKYGTETAEYIMAFGLVF